jgi:hypothetical protein
MERSINFFKAQKKLVVHWCVSAALIFVIFFIQTLTGRFEGSAGEVWKWLFQFILPPLSLMIGVLINQLSSQGTSKNVDLFYFRLALGISYFFLILLLFSSFLVPFMYQSAHSNTLITEITEETKKTIVDSFNSYNSFLLPVQGFTTLALGLFFTKPEK